jgi:carboxymethylenebutenolidase
VALAPDLLSRVGGTGKMKTPGETIRAINAMPTNRSVEDLKAGFAFLEKQPNVDPQKIASVGFGWGGWRSFMLAEEVPTLYRAIVFYGSTPGSDLEKIHAPVLAHYAQFDHQVTGNAIWTENTMKQLGKKYTYYVYSNVYPAFFNETGPRYDPEASKLAWTRTLEFLRGS